MHSSNKNAVILATVLLSVNKQINLFNYNINIVCSKPTNKKNKFDFVKPRNIIFTVVGLIIIVGCMFTYSEGLNSSIIDVILNNGINIYTVNTERRLTYSQIVENPNITYEYPRTYIYTSIDVQGVLKYVIARIVYIGIDYG